MQLFVVLCMHETDQVVMEHERLMGHFWSLDIFFNIAGNMKTQICIDWAKHACTLE